MLRKMPKIPVAFDALSWFEFGQLMVEWTTEMDKWIAEFNELIDKEDGRCRKCGERCDYC